MGLLGISLLVASVVYICLRPQPLMNYFAHLWRSQGRIEPAPAPATADDASRRSDNGVAKNHSGAANGKPSDSKAEVDWAAMPPPPPVIQPPSISTTAPPALIAEEEEEQTTPKAKASLPAVAVPTFSLTSDDTGDDTGGAEDEDEDHDIPSDPPMFPAANSAQRARGPSPSASSGMMPPPPPPPGLSAPGSMPPPPGPRQQPGAMPPPPRPPSLSSSNLQPPPTRSLPVPNRSAGPLPNRGPPSSSPSSSLALPPTHTTKPKSKKVQLSPGHSPLDWARLSSSPTSDLRNLPASTPYLRVTPSQLKTMNGRRGRDAWTALGGRVYNITPYVPFHPGGAGELLRCAGKDGNRLFGEVHPWVNYETMLAACLVGILVEEGDTGASSQMEEMD